MRAEAAAAAAREGGPGPGGSGRPVLDAARSLAPDLARVISVIRGRGQGR